MTKDEYGGYLNAYLYFKHLLSFTPHSNIWHRGNKLYTMVSHNREQWVFNITTYVLTKKQAMTIYA